MPLRCHITVPELGYRHDAHSLLANFLSYLAAEINESTQPYVDINGLPQNISYSVARRGFGGAIGSLTRGTVLGTGTFPVDIEDHDLETLITNGAGVGQLSYGAQSFGAVVRPNNHVELTTSRQVVNNSGGSIIVNEVGIRSTFIGGGFTSLQFREVVEPFAILPGATRTVSITFVISA